MRRYGAGFTLKTSERERGLLAGINYRLGLFRNFVFMSDDFLKKQKVYTQHQALVKAEAWCAYQERCQQEVRDKIYSWGLHEHEVENVIAELISKNFLNEERFAKAYAGGKFRIKKWGRVKIRMELKRR